MHLFYSIGSVFDEGAAIAATGPIRPCCADRCRKLGDSPAGVWIPGSIGRMPLPHWRGSRSKSKQSCSAASHARPGSCAGALETASCTSSSLRRPSSCPECWTGEFAAEHDVVRCGDILQHPIYRALGCSRLQVSQPAGSSVDSIAAQVPGRCPPCDDRIAFTWPTTQCR